MKRTKKLFIKRVIFFILLLSMAFPRDLVLFLDSYFSIKKIEAATSTLTSTADFNAGNFSSTEAASRSGELRLTASGSWSARVWKTPSIALGDQSSITSDGVYIYVKPAGDNLFQRYDPVENKWRNLANAPRFSLQGSDMKVIGENIYATFGGYQNEFYKYSIPLNTWTKLTNLPDLTTSGASISTDGTNIYALRGTATTDFWKYTVSTNTWSTLAAAPATISTGGSLSYSSGYFYTPRGGNTNTFYRYDISGNSWSTLATLPATMNSNGSITVNGNYIYALRGGSTNTFYRYDISGNSWSTLTNTPQVTGFVGVVYHSGDGNIYVFRGNNTQEMWKYDILTNTFVGMNDLPNTPGTGADLIHHSGYLYYARGNSSTNLYRYDLTSGAWSALLAVFPAALGDDVKGAAAGSYIYYPRGSSTTAFYRYDPSGNSFTTLAVSPATLGGGSTVAYPGSGDYLYVTRGLNTRTFYRYSISGNTWDDAGAADIPDDADAGIGARMITDGTDVYYLSGLGTSRLLKYTVATNTWSTLDNAPFATYYGTDMNYYNGKLYFQAGYYKNDFWEYTLSTNIWRRLPDLQSNFAYDQGPYNGASLASDGAGHFYSTLGANSLWWQSFTVGSTNYPSSGTWTSGVMDLTYVSAWNSLSATVETPGDTGVTYETRSSTDNVSWSSWQSVSGGSISSPVRRYIQVRVTLTSSTGQTLTPVVKDISINYDGDMLAPTNASTFNGSSQSSGGVALSSGNTYGYTNPYFTWSGASDAETSIAGYYVYFGSNSSADPQSAGALQTASTYTVTTPMSNNTYFLRIKTVDSAGNVSASSTGFTYVYSGVSATSVTKTSTADFSAATLTNTAVANDEIKLSGREGFWEQDRLSVPPAGVSSGAGWAYVSSSNKLYTFRGASTTTFYEYSITSDTWTSLAVSPATVSTGGTIAPGPSGYLYAARGGNTTSYWRYDISANTWDDGAAADAPQSISAGSSSFYDGSRYIYVLKGNGDDTFMRYDTQLDVWDLLANTDFNAPTDHQVNTVTTGGDLAFNGTDTIFAIQGGGYAGFSSYNISDNTWSTLPNLPAVSAAEGAQIEYDSTSNAVYFTPANNKTALFKYDIAAEEWSQLADAPMPLTTSSAMRIVDGIIYLLRGGGTTNFYTYDISKSSWQIPNYGLFGDTFRGTDIRTFTTGGQILRGQNDNFYIVRGAVDSIFTRYNSSSGEIVHLADAPAGISTGATFTYDTTADKIYALANSLSRRLFVYDVDLDSWSEEVLDPPPFDPAAGTSLRYDGSRYIYYLRGGNTTAFYRYDTQANAGSRWSSALAVVPGTVGAGSKMIVRGGYIYTLRGNNQISFYRYDINAGTWSDPAVADLPSGVTVGADGFLADGGDGTLYACRALNTSTCYQYSISDNTWTAIANAPANITSGAEGASNLVDRLFVIAGPGTNTFNNGLYSYVMSTANSSFEESGTYESDAINLGSVYKFANLTVNYTSAANASVTVYTRTSSDDVTYSSWAQTSEGKTNGTTTTYKINSPAADYLEVKFQFASNGVYSGKITDYSVNYYGDQTVPTNPTSISGYNSATQSASVTTSNWANHVAPYFSWPDDDAVGGATDGEAGSGIAGYYVYFGTDNGADAQTDGALQSSTNFTAGSLVSGSTYYLKIKAVDNAGNLAVSNWDAFTYKFDNVAPDNPSTVTADPSGYTAINDFDFAWSGASDSASGVVSYCYKTALAGAETCDVVGSSITGVEAEGTGASTFYIRATDAAGNRASTYSSVSYYYSSTAPSAPQNLQVSPSSNTVNQFSFSWSPPLIYFGSQANLRYFWSVNALPTSQNVNSVGLTVTNLATDAYATVPGENIMYVVAKDEAGNIDYNNYAQIEFTADTSAPGVPVKPDIADISVKALEAWKLAITWEAPVSSGSGVSTYKIYGSTVDGASCTDNFDDFSYIASTTGRSYVDTDLDQVDYYYCAKACDSTNNCSAPSSTVTMLPTGKFEAAAELTASPSATVKTKSAIIEWATSRTSNSFVRYGTSSGDYGTEVGSSTQVTAHEIELENLAPGTTYYYQALWTDEDGNLGESEELKFTTEPAPVISSVKISNISIDSALVNFAVQHSTSVKVLYGPTINYGGVETLATSKDLSSYTLALEGLEEGSEYHVQIVAEDAEGNIFLGDDYTFETLPQPKITAFRMQQVAGQATATLRLLWSSNTTITSVVTYYPTNNPSAARDNISLVLRRNHSVILSDLLDETDYTVIVKGNDSAGNEAAYTPQSVKTAADLRSPEIENMNVESTITGVGDEARAQLVISWDTDELGTSQIEYSEGTGATYSQSSQEDTSLTSNHSVTISGLNPSSIYHLRAVSKDKSNNIGYSFDTVVVTPKSTKDAFTLVIENLANTFGFLKGIK